jgi:succinate dehydrogenase / fumarate reductase, cytochrome b subunit
MLTCAFSRRNSKLDRMSPPTRVLRSTVGTKLLIGATGLALFGYLLIHIAGNLVVFGGQAAFNKYAYTLEDNPLLPVIEILLALLFLTHIYKTVANFLGNKQARPVSYVKKARAGNPSRKSFASSTMIVTGLWIVVFLMIHVTAFRAGWGHEYPWPDGGRDLYRQELETFHNPLTAVFYVLSMLVVGTHLWHGLSSSLQSLGLDHPRWTPRIIVAGRVLAVLISGTFIVIAIWAHIAGHRL